MRWTAKPPLAVGDERIVRRFLLLPRTIGGERRWLEVARIHQRFAGWNDDEAWFGNPAGRIWHDVAWIDSSEPEREG